MKKYIKLNPKTNFDEVPPRDEAAKRKASTKISQNRRKKISNTEESENTMAELPNNNSNNSNSRLAVEKPVNIVVTRKKDNRKSFKSLH
jgi:hypothetical protein